MRHATRPALRMRFDAFVSHAWHIDTEGRCTHERVKRLSDHMALGGCRVWLDEDQMSAGCNVDAAMASGIRASKAVCVCLTKRYIEKVNAQERRDNCAKEWNFAHAMGKTIIPLVMEPSMLDVRAWPPGVVSMYLSNALYVDCTSDDELPTVAQKLGRVLRSKSAAAPVVLSRKRAHRSRRVIIHI